MKKTRVCFVITLLLVGFSGCAKLRYSESVKASEKNPNLSQCKGCHGGTENAAPPRDTSGGTGTTLVSVGAHQSHLVSNISSPLGCSDCHVVPTQITDEGHLGSGPAQISFGALAKNNDIEPVWDRTSATCASTYCHGGTLNGGMVTKPQWTKVDGSQSSCDSCHGFPPPAPHPNSSECASCHTETMGPDGTIAHPEKHINGSVEVINQSCNSCHGSGQNAAPPKDRTGETSTSLVTVGAHQAHLGSQLTTPIACGECHIIPNQVGDQGHLGEAPAELTFGGRATTGGLTPAWDRTSETCSSTYCHGGTLHGGSANKPKWTQVDGSQAGCDSCHGFPPATPHPDSFECGTCHTETIGADGTIAHPEKHIDGKVEVSGQSCNSCHGSEQNAAPPKDRSGGTSTTLVTVGAHQAHLGSQLTTPVRCSECHIVPSQVGSPNHVDSAPAELTFGGRATTGGLTPAWDRTSETCSSTYCHGGTLHGGSANKPKWTQVDGSQAGCDSCHGFPPATPHPDSFECGTCHTETIGADGTIAHPEKHIDGKVEVSGQSCNSCHGSEQNAAPPKDRSGGTSTTLVTVGAHQAHLGSQLTTPVACGECHTVPGQVSDPGHIDSAPAELTFGGRATTGGLTPSWDRTSATCSSTYCHGGTLHGGSANKPTWTQVDGTQAGCDSCHGYPPPAPHPDSFECGTCHTETIGGDGSIAHPEKHIDGKVEVISMSCNSCHGSEQNAAPPKDRTGGTSTTLVTVGAHQAHLNAHVSLPVTCNECHVVPTQVGEQGHMDSAEPAELTFGGRATNGGLTPTWDRTSVTCSSTYCHGGSLVGGAVTKPLWTQVDGTQSKCESCHAMPPATGKHSSNFKKHSFMKKSCINCHRDIVNSDSTAILKPELHINGVKDVRSKTGSWDPATKSCTMVCHGEPMKW